MKVAITGHTRGIGLEIFNYFQSQGHECVGFSRSNGYDISKVEDRGKIVEETLDCDIFVNNACTYIDNSQLSMLDDFYQNCTDESKIIINISSRAGDFIDETNHPNHSYFLLKNKQDIYCMSHKKNIWVINLRPGMTDTDSTKHIKKNKMNVKSILKVLDFIFLNKSEFKVKSITFGD